MMLLSSGRCSSLYRSSAVAISCGVVALQLVLGPGCGNRKIEDNGPRHEVGSISGPLRVVVDAAKQGGRADAKLGGFGDAHDPGSLQEVLARSGVWLLRAVEPNALIRAEASSIATYSVFDLIETLRSKPSPEDCPDAGPASLRLSDKRIALPFGGGTLDIEGVRTTVENTFAPPTITNGATYVAIGNVCGIGVLRLEAGAWGVVEVGRDGKLIGLRSPEHAPGLYSQLLDLGTLDGLRAFIKKID
jgi:hypothetical protein